ncbi:MAG: glycosyltransferase family 2 protein [Verrucomicrobia bacterium]|nr:glycosyltransferase family 2 protein [Verrucomicrobiota bacterium]
MRLVAVSIVKNEADIIEPFVRHTLAWVDHHLVFDHDSSDGTREILGALQAEGLALTLFTDHALGNLQQARSNRLTALAAREHGADWILPLDADEILTGPGRAALEQHLASHAADRPATLPLLNYFPTEQDNPDEENPVRRLQTCQAFPPRTRKIMVPRALALDPAVKAGKGSHALYRGEHALPDQPLPVGFHLSRLALRSPPHQLLRVVLAELQKLSRGRAHAGLDVHYRLGFQLLTENPELFFATVRQPAASGRHLPIPYLGGPLRHTPPSIGWNRVARALLAFLEKLAVSHGQLLDAAGPGADDVAAAEATLRQLGPDDFRPATQAGRPEAFSGFQARSGWGEPEGPVPDAFLPQFHWGYAPATEISIASDRPRTARLVAEVLSYWDDQAVTVTLNGAPLLEHAFSRVNQKEFLQAPLALQAGDNRLVFHYRRHVTSEVDPRKLAVIFLSLRILD